jgi:nucleotide-binding universal stress UspA family protein
MYNIKRILVALDLSAIDDTLIEYVSRITRNISVDKVYFVNVVKRLELPKEIEEKYPEMIAPVDETIKKEIQFTIDNNGPDSLKAPYEIDVLEGNVTEKILHWIKVKNVDLAVVGNKAGLRHHGILTGKLAKLAPCSISLIPEMLPKEINRVVVPVDFSDASKLAAELAIEIASHFPGSEIDFLHVFCVPSGYHISGKSYEEFAGILEANAKKHMDQFISKLDTKGVTVSDHYKLDTEERLANAIYNYALKEHAPAIILGSRGRTRMASMVMGSIAEKIIQLNTHFPLIIAKSKDDALDIFDVIAH